MVFTFISLCWHLVKGLLLGNHSWNQGLWWGEKLCFSYLRLTASCETPHSNRRWVWGETWTFAAFPHQICPWLPWQPVQPCWQRCEAVVQGNFVFSSSTGLLHTPGSQWHKPLLKPEPGGIVTPLKGQSCCPSGQDTATSEISGRFHMVLTAPWQGTAEPVSDAGEMYWRIYWIDRILRINDNLGIIYIIINKN